MSPITEDQVDRKLESHQTNCLRVIELNLANITNSLSQAHAKLDTTLDTVNEIKVQQAGTEARLKSGSGHFAQIDGEMSKIKEKVDSVQMNVWKLIVCLALAGGSGAAAIRLLFGGS